jgi:SsrA-binding protein
VAKPQGPKVIADNRKARHDYTLLERVEAGVQLLGTEVKSLRANGATLAQAHAEERGGELWLVGAHIAPYDKSGGASGHEPERDRKLLLHRISHPCAYSMANILLQLTSSDVCPRCSG